MKISLSAVVGVLLSGLGSISAFALIASQDAIPASVIAGTFGGDACERCEANQYDCPSNNLTPGGICTGQNGTKIKKCDGTAGKGCAVNTQQKSNCDAELMGCPMGIVYECKVFNKPDPDDDKTWVYTWQDSGKREQCDQYSFCEQEGVQPCPPTPPGTGE